MTKQNNIYNQTVNDNLRFLQSELFALVQTSSIFSDSKIFADAIAKTDYEEIYHQFALRFGEYPERKIEKLQLKQFIEQYFELPKAVDLIKNRQGSATKIDIDKTIEELWQLLEHDADQCERSSLLALNFSYIVPGGRFREIYYWDSYFTALGLLKSNRIKLVENMVNNFIDLQANYGCIPNGNRSYYLSRSQPPILALLVDLLVPYQSNKIEYIASKINAIEDEYLFWMQGQEQLSLQNKSQKRVVLMPNGSVLNRYWDDLATPRPESYREDIELLATTEFSTTAEQQTFYRNIRAACESGWDFSSRWLGEEQSLASIRTTNIVPIDLNSLLYQQEILLSHYYQQLNNHEKSHYYLDCSKRRKLAIDQYMWSTQLGFFMDYDLLKLQCSPIKSMAAVLPLFTKLASKEQALQISKVISSEFLKPGGLLTTTEKSNQQWDSPNGWAPLHWFCVQGLRHYDQTSLAATITKRWLNTVEHYFYQTDKLMEKYNVCQQDHEAGGGEYDVQEGFGWTNGVYQALVCEVESHSIE